MTRKLRMSRTSLPAVCVIAVLVAPATARRQHQSPTPDQQEPQPFAFERKLLNPRSLEFWGERVRAYTDAVARHDPGRADRSAETYAWLMPTQIETLVAAFEAAVARTPANAARRELIERAVLLHTDIAIMADVISSREDRINAGDVASLHLGAALELVGLLQRVGPGGAKDRFGLAWWRAVAALLGSRQEMMSAPLFMQRAVRMFPRDADILLMAGGVRELIASPIVQDAATAAARDIRDAHGNEDDNLRAAERCYREALAAEPHADEPRVRLGRVLVLRGRYEEALRELDGKMLAMDAPATRYFGYLFLGEAHEKLHDLEAARAAFQHAVELFPGAQSASLALGRLEGDGGDKARSVAAVERLLERPAGDREDPWLRYFITGPARRSAELLEALRAPFRRLE